MTLGKIKKIAAAAGLALSMGVGTRAQMSPIPHKEIYPSIEVAPTEIRAALAEAMRTHKRVILDFGGNWCPDCQVLNIYFNQSPNADLMAKNFVLVDVNMGREDANLDLATKYGVPMPHGVPALVVVEGNGKVLYSQNKEFSDMRHLDSSALTEFLNKWKP